MSIVTPSRKVSPLVALGRRFGFFLVVIVPTALAVLYYLFMASDVFVTESRFAVRVEQASVPAITSGTFLPMLSQSANLPESFITKEFVHSQRMLDGLEKTIRLRSLYSGDNADMLARLPSDVTQDEYLDYFRAMNPLRFDEHSGILYLKTRAFSAQDAATISKEILKLAEDFVNAMSARVQADSISFAEAELKKSEADLEELSQRIGSFRTSNQNFNPNATTQTAVEIIAKLEGELAAVNSQIAHAETYMKEASPVLVGLRSKAAALTSEIAQQNKKLTSKTSPLAGMTQSYNALEAQYQFALKRYELALATFEAAQAEARKKTIYLLRIEDPVLPQTAAEPERIKQIITVFLASLMAYLIGRIVLSSIWDHVRP